MDLRGGSERNLAAEIGEQVGSLPKAMQEQVLRYISSLNQGRPAGENGASLRKFGSTLDSQSAREMIHAIEEECEGVDGGEW